MFFNKLMTTRLHTYALVKTLFDQHRDYFDTFITLVLRVANSGSFEGLAVIQDKLKKEFEIDIPLHILKTICNRALNKNYLDQQVNQKSYKLSTKGVDFLSKQEEVTDVERRINSLIFSAKEFFKSRGVSLNEGKVQELLYSFIEENIDGLIDFVSPKIESKNIARTVSKRDGAIFLEFLVEIQERKPIEYKQFQELVFGSILSSLLIAESSSDISEINSKKFSGNTIFFDTNIVFSLLGFHSNEKNTAAKELVEILRKAEFKLMVFDFTVDEVCRVMNGYIRYKNIYPTNFAVDSVYSFLKIKGWGYSDVADFIDGIEDLLHKQSISIYVTDIVELSDYKSAQRDSLKASIASNKESDHRGLSTNHDLAAIDLIRKIRKKTVRRMEEARAFFLTSDFALQRSVLVGLGHHESGSLSEVILDRVMANILWLKNPQIDLPLGMIIAAHSRDLLVDRKIWDKFYSVLEKLRSEGTIADNKIDTLFYQNNIESFLRDYSRKDVDKIDERLVVDEIEKAADAALVDRKNALLEHSVVKDQLFEAQSEKDKEEQVHNQKIIEIKSGLRKKAEGDSRRISWIVAVVLLLAVLLSEFYFFLVCYPKIVSKLPFEYSDVLSGPYGGLGLFIAPLSAAFILWARKRVEPMIFESFHKRLLKQLALDS